MYGDLCLSLQDGSSQVAVKVIEKALLKQEPKQKENLEREINIMKLLANCEFVVKILDAQVRTYVYTVDVVPIHTYSRPSHIRTHGTSPSLDSM